jgi:uncharacterized membrane protein
VLTSVRQVERQGRLRLQDTALVSKDADGRVRVQNEVSSATEVATVGGALLGPLLLFLFPLAGLVLGAAGGALVGRLLDKGIDSGFVDEVKRDLQPGQSALFLLGDGAPDALMAAIRGHRGTVHQTTVSPELEAELRHAMNQ